MGDVPVSCCCSPLICSAVCALLVFASRDPVAEARKLMKVPQEKDLKIEKIFFYHFNLFCE